MISSLSLSSALEATSASLTRSDKLPESQCQGSKGLGRVHNKLFLFFPLIRLVLINPRDRLLAELYDRAYSPAQSSPTCLKGFPGAGQNIKIQ